MVVPTTDRCTRRWEPLWDRALYSGEDIVPKMGALVGWDPGGALTLPEIKELSQCRITARCSHHSTVPPKWTSSRLGMLRKRLQWMLHNSQSWLVLANQNWQSECNRNIYDAMKAAFKNQQHIVTDSVFLQPELKLMNLLNFAQNTTLCLIVEDQACFVQWTAL